MTSTIRSRVADALSGKVANQAFSVMQIEEELDLVRADFVHKYAGTEKLDVSFLYQTIDSVPIVCTDMSQNCALEIGEGVPSIKVPSLMPITKKDSIEYIGLVNKQNDFLVYYDTDEVSNHKYRLKTKHMPYVWVDNTLASGEHITIYFFNLGKYNELKYVSIRAAFEHPTRVYGFNPNTLDTEYPAPGHMQNAIIDNLTEKYIRYYRQMNVPGMNNTQNDPIT